MKPLVLISFRAGDCLPANAMRVLKQICKNGLATREGGY